jgi:KaiC/GvpD/RAD55 family RecA-like ATPase
VLLVATAREKTGTWKFIILTNAHQIVDSVTREIKQHRSVVVDSLSELLITRKTEELVNLLTIMAKENKECEECHFVLLTEGMQDKKVEITMEHFAEGAILFNTTWTGDSTNRHIMIKKMRGTLTPTRRLPYNIGKKGVIIEAAIRITQVMLNLVCAYTLTVDFGNYGVQLTKGMRQTC